MMSMARWPHGRKLLQYHPDFPQKDLVQHMITQAKETKAKTLGGGQKG